MISTNPQTAQMNWVGAFLVLPASQFSSTDTLSDLQSVLPILPARADRPYSADPTINFPTSIGANGLGFNVSTEIDTISIPEPTSVALGAGVALAGLTMRRRRPVVSSPSI